MGNPTSYLGRTLTWEGKQLKKLETTIGSAAIEFDFDYDENGLRTSKTLIYPAPYGIISLLRGAKTMNRK